MSKGHKFTFFLGLFFSLSTTANANILVCPTNIACNYEEGTCDQPQTWYLNFWVAGASFSEMKNLSLSGIYGVKASGPNIDPYDKIAKTKIECVYMYGDYHAIKLVTYVKKLIGENWSFDGFGKFHGTCTDITNPAACAGEN